MQTFSHPFEPFVDKDSKVLILGTFPSLKSFEQNFYYSHPKNQFWRLLAMVYSKELPKTIDEKKLLLKKHCIALWDVIKECKRENSSDSNLKDIVPNDIEDLLKNYPNILKVCFTSKTAQKIYHKHFLDLKMQTHYLPSPSPAYQVMKFEDKLEIYKAILKDTSCEV